MKTVIPLLLLLAPAASAEPLARYLVGGRVGGYGFHRAGSEEGTGWDECRMNGLGVFGQRRLSEMLFLEGGLDLYSRDQLDLASASSDLPLDRMSGLITFAAGARMTHSRFAGHVQLGAGLEATRVSVPYGDDRISDSMVLPLGFVGMGGEILLTHHTRVGVTLRIHAMGNFSYDPESLAMQEGWTTPPRAAEVFAPEPDAAAHAQFYLAHDLE